MNYEISKNPKSNLKSIYKLWEETLFQYMNELKKKIVNFPKSPNKSTYEALLNYWRKVDKHMDLYSEYEGQYASSKS